MSSEQNKAIIIFKALRVYQWTKNLLVLAALVFARDLMEPKKVFVSLLAFAAFCMAASANYLFNDLMDMEKDRAHPEKRHRPLPSGALSPATAWALLVALACGSFALAYAIRLEFLLCVLFYIALTTSYSIALKKVVIIDVMALAMGFVVRAMAGAIALDVAFSNWLVVCTLFLALFLGLCKRRHELTSLEGNAQNHRSVLRHYSTQYLDQLILIMAGGTLITYTIYTCSPEVVDRMGTDKLYLTIPFVLYGLFRYLFLVQRRADGGDPSSTLLRDWPLGTTVVVWAVCCGAIIYG